MPPTSRPQLISLKVCEGISPLLKDEKSTMKALERIRHANISPQLKNSSYLYIVLASLTKSSVIFAVDRDTIRDAVIHSEGPPGELDLPPLPFTNIVVEAATDDVWFFGQKVDGIEEEPDSALEVFAIQEIHQGLEWRCQFFIRDETVELPEKPSEHPWRFIALVVTSDRCRIDTETLKAIGIPTTDLVDSNYSSLHRFVLEAAHFITARGVSLTMRKLPRAERREAFRKGIELPEAIYFVTVSDQVINGVESIGAGREYHCRWLVRGHWRHLTEQQRTWIRPYIKGPAGAPWRGRPVYKVKAT